MQIRPTLRYRHRITLLGSAGALLFATLSGRPAATAAAQTTAAAAPDSYYGVYLQSAKLGHIVVRRDDHARRGSRAAVRTESAMTLDLQILGGRAQQTTTSVSWAEPGTGRVLAQETRSESAGRISTTTAEYSAAAVTYTTNVQGATRTGTLNLKPGEKFLFDPSSSPDFKPKVGLTLKGKLFVPELLKLIDSETQVVAQETISVNGQSVPAFKVLDKNPLGASTLYLNADGDLLRGDMPLGMQIRREPKEVALAAPGAAQRMDLITLVGVRPTGVALEKPRETTRARYRLEGVTRSLPATDSVQSVEYAPASGPVADKNERIATVSITADALPTLATAPLFRSPAEAPEPLRRYLAATVYVTSDDPAFKALAQRTLGAETDAARAAALIAAYVNRTVKPDPGIAALRTAKDIQRDPRGVCRDYTTYFTTIARAAGLPTKQCVGMVYANGTFLYHAWPEVWVGRDAVTGADRWVALEPTFGAPFADATHIKLAEGEVTDIFNVAADMGRYKVTVLEAR